MTTPETAASYQNQNYIELRRNLVAKKQIFEDKVFPAETDSLCFEESYKDQLLDQLREQYQDQLLDTGIEWLRPGVLYSVESCAF